MTQQLFDSGLQPERTELAWQRTALAFGVAVVLGFRLVGQAFGAATWAWPVLLGIVLVGALYAAAHRRYHRTNAALFAERADELPDGTLPLVVSSMSALLATGSLVIVATMLLMRL